MFWVFGFHLGPHAQLPVPWDIRPAVLVLLHVFRLHISRQWREMSSSQPAEGALIPYRRHHQRQSLVTFGFISAQVAQHPQVILGRALGHQCRHPPRLNHEQLPSSSSPDGRETWFWSCRRPAAQLSRGRHRPRNQHHFLLGVTVARVALS